MAMSLEDLLVDEGFKGRKSKTITRASTGILPKRIPIYPTRDENKVGRVRKTERAYSDANRYDLSAESPVSDRVKGRRSIDVVGRLKSDTRERHARRSSEDMQGVRSIESSKQSSIDGIVVDGLQDKRRYRDAHLNGSSGNYQKIVKQTGSSSSRSSITQSKGDKQDSRVREPVSIDQSGSQFALDKLAIKAIISILNDHTKRFIMDQDVRTSLLRNCLDLFNFTESKVISNLKEAIKIVERAADELADGKELKKAALQLSVITGLSANDIKDGFTNGISNSVLSACGHLYLSVIYHIQKKERIAARHLLQVFIDSPFSARTKLAPDLWNNIFYPHLLHLDEWYNEEVNSLADDAGNTRKLKKVKKLYDEIVDVGTYEFALYYKNWLTDGVEAPTIPTINVPLVSFKGIQQGGSFGSFGHSLDFSTPANAFTPLHIVSKKSSDSACSNRQTVQRSDDSRKSFDGSLVEDKMTVTHSLENEYIDFHIKQYSESDQDVLVAQEALELRRANALVKFRNAILPQDGPKSTNMSPSLPIGKVNELTIKMLAKSIFEQPPVERSVAVIETYDAHPQIEARPVGGGKGRFSCDIPHDYLCPLTGLLFKDPVTLENGQTYERVAIAEWFSKGNKTCPVTGEILEHHNVPHINIILTSVIDGWKEEHCRNILASACQLAGSPWEQKFKDEEAVFILEQLLTVFGEEEDKRIGKHLLAFGGLHFVIKRFEYGDWDEKTRVAALLLCCIKADSSCRINVTRSIDKDCLFELLHCKEAKSIANAVLLLFELVCLNRRKDVQFFVNGVHKESILSSMHVLLVYLQSCSPAQRPLVAVLLLHLDLMVDQQKYNTYREQAVDTTSLALDSSLLDEKVRVSCCRALLILGGRISFSGMVMTEDWILKKAGFLDGPELKVQEDEVPMKDNIFSNSNIIHECKEEEVAVNKWLMKISASLLGDQKKSFLYSISRCLKSGDREITRVCLTTMAWLSSTLASLHSYKSQVSVFSIVINQLKENLKDGESLEHRILAAMSLLHFSKIPECRELLMTIANEITTPLKDLCEATWMAKELYALISQED
ncbi:zinc finger, RING/FYVE/PHD-type, Armadillo-type fold protein [Artemisia annua]|uniref:RING-type E3 ubiquitin transferase n=1 Tax=Artemisia annua TaxID=35608 RepID=A0A2U1PLY4_ARTAN|nr:zinc finger, RING/FYVE/PHD-type, Armadillo-type fold protein [Artemisia annua]